VLRITIAIGTLWAVLACVPQPAKPRDVSASGTVTVLSDGPVKTRPFVFGADDGVLSNLTPTRTFVSVDSPVDNGVLTASMVPGGPYYLKSGLNFMFSAQPAIDLSLTRIGRDNAITAAANTRLTLTVSGLTSWTDPSPGSPTASRDHLELFSAGAGLYDFAPEQRGTSPSQGATSITTSFNYAADAGLVEANRGDALTITQLESHPLTGDTVPYFSVRRALTIKNVTVQNAGSTPITAALSSVTTNVIGYTWDLASFAAQGKSVNPNAGTPIFGLFITAMPPDASPLTWDGLDLMFLFFNSNNPQTQIAAFSYGNPIPTYTEVGAVQAGFDVSYTAEGARGSTFRGRVGFFIPAAGLEGPTHRPLMTPPQSPRLDGKDAFLPVSTKTETPELTWDAPATGTARAYHIDVFQLTSTGGTTTFELTGRIRTRERKINIPPGVMTSGSQYLIRLRAVDAGFDADKQPFQEQLPISFADALTATVTP